MRIRKSRVIIAVAIILLSVFFVTRLFELPEKSVVNSVLKNEVVKEFVETHNEEYRIDYLDTQQLSDLKNSKFYALYVALPDKPVYRVLITENGRGYLAFVDAETKELIDITEAYNLEIQ